MTSWKQMSTAALRSVPRSAPFSARARALKEAGQRYRAQSGRRTVRSGRRSSSRRNPERNPGLPMLAVYGIAAAAGYALLKRRAGA